MSFYGNVTYYLSNAFSKIIYRNANASCSHDGIQVNDGVSCPAPNEYSYEYTLSPRSRNDDVILENGNKWIIFADPNGTQGNNQIQIFHKASNSGGTIQTSIRTPTSEQASSATSFDFGDMITIPTITFDEAGHISGVTTMAYVTPIPAGLGDLDSLKHRMAMLELKLHGTPGDAGNTPISQSDIMNNTALTTEIEALQVKTNDWLMTPGASAGDPYANFKELKGIGSTLHDLMCKVGVRKTQTYNDGGVDDKIGFVTVDDDHAPSGSIIYNTNFAVTQAQTSAIVAIQNRNGLRELIPKLWAKNILTDDERDHFMDEVFFSTNININNNP